MEYRLYKTKAKLSSLLSSGNLLQLGQQQPQSTQSSHHQFYILTFRPARVDQDVDSGDGLDSVWFNRNNGEIAFKKSRLVLIFILLVNRTICYLYPSSHKFTRVSGIGESLRLHRKIPDQLK